jgi:opacity protein-like surface antigen
MRRVLILAAAFLALASTAALAAPIKAGIGAYGGISIPILNDLSKQGSQFGIRIPIHTNPFLTVEPYYTSAALGDATQNVSGIDYTRDGGDLSGYGVNVLYSFGVFYPWGGIGSYTIKRTGADDLKKFGYQAGIGFGFKIIPDLSLHVRGGLDVVTTDGTSQKFGEVNVGLNYALFPF